MRSCISQQQTSIRAWAEGTNAGRARGRVKYGQEALVWVWVGGGSHAGHEYFRRDESQGCSAASPSANEAETAFLERILRPLSSWIVRNPISIPTRRTASDCDATAHSLVIPRPHRTRLQTAGRESGLGWSWTQAWPPARIWLQILCVSSLFLGHSLASSVGYSVDSDRQ